MLFSDVLKIFYAISMLFFFNVYLSKATVS